jgi:hypothetical protein
MSVAKTILAQIKAQDFWALGAWAAKQYVALADNAGVQFKVNCPKLKHGIVKIVLDEGADLYNVHFMKVWGGKLTVNEVIEGVYCDQLVQVIDNRLG